MEGQDEQQSTEKGLLELEILPPGVDLHLGRKGRLEPINLWLHLLTYSNWFLMKDSITLKRSQFTHFMILCSPLR